MLIMIMIRAFIYLSSSFTAQRKWSCITWNRSKTLYPRATTRAWYCEARIWKVMCLEHTFVMLKPSAIVRGLIGEIINRLERKGLKVIAMRMTSITSEKAQKLYAVHEGKPFFENLVRHITSVPVVVIVIEGEEAVRVVRKLVGATDPKDAEPGTIRGDFAMSIDKNVIHAADSHENAQREIEVFFTKDELLAYERVDDEWIY